MSERFANRTMIVTGGSYGIGAAVTQLFLREGARVVVVARGTRAPDLEFERWGSDRVRSVTGDLSEPETSADAVKSALNWGGRLDAVVNNAGMDYTGELLAAPFEDVQRVFATNVFGVILMLQAAANAMKSLGGGSIVNVTSRLAVCGVPTMVVYGASKGAVLSLTRGAAVELAPLGIRVNAVAPGLTETPLVTAWLNRQDDPAATRREAMARIPQGRFAGSEEVASTIAFLVSDEAAHITGASIAVDGGYTAA
jgi:NAD(P)-dependent dehydrogenase (short-subunit alcohol dehydrogenase family)